MKLRCTSVAGFTLMEIMLVVAIIAILVGLLIRNSDGVIKTGKETAAKANLGNLRTNLIQYSIKAGNMPSTEQGLKALVVQPEGEPKPMMWEQVLEEMPVDPWGREYVYLKPGMKKSKSYDLFSKGEDGQANTADDVW